MGLQYTTAYIMAYGVAIMASGAVIVPALLRTLGARGFTAFSNFTVSGRHNVQQCSKLFVATTNLQRTIA